MPSTVREIKRAWKIGHCSRLPFLSFRFVVCPGNSVWLCGRTARTCYCSRPPACTWFARLCTGTTGRSQSQSRRTPSEAIDWNIFAVCMTELVSRRTTQIMTNPLSPPKKPNCNAISFAKIIVLRMTGQDRFIKLPSLWMDLWIYTFFSVQFNRSSNQFVMSRHIAVDLNKFICAPTRRKKTQKPTARHKQ